MALQEDTETKRPCSVAICRTRLSASSTSGGGNCPSQIARGGGELPSHDDSPTAANGAHAAKTRNRVGPCTVGWIVGPRLSGRLPTWA